jgi:signal-transduction protein with cAMP-binding, CBS, and nucleotidyltransferase domain
MLCACPPLDFRIELFKQGVDILSAGEPVNELLLLCSGQVEVRWVGGGGRVAAGRRGWVGAWQLVSC